MFIRIKKIKGQEYAYSVNNKWTKKGTRQKTKKYLGKVYRIDKDKEIMFDNNGEGYKGMISSLVKWELIQRGFNDEGKCVMKEDIMFNTKTLDLGYKERPVSLVMNEGILNNMTIKRILNFKRRDFEHETMYEFAKVWVEAGIAIPKEVFVNLYEMVG